MLAIGHLGETIRYNFVSKYGTSFISALNCLIRNAHVSVYDYGENIFAVSILLISLDRLLVVFQWKYYIILHTKTYLKLQLILAAGISVELIHVWIQAAMIKTLIQNNCDYGAIVGKQRRKAHLYWVIIAVYLSVSVSLFVLAAAYVKRKTEECELWNAEFGTTRAVCCSMISCYLIQFLPQSIYFLTRGTLLQYAIFDNYLSVLNVVNLSVSSAVYLVMSRALYAPFISVFRRINFRSTRVLPA
ncbi:unnamed protein product [Soboliphyme baturini]|uniref:G_PROTEIN_RECEP_F1_2 domain-containing protein n=1 Tax=Soboliphyme baturini TaxID=241478 RepID=A0A183J869_9BILA|nr:unnamed protein product [Soboliphyme baturini]